MEDQEERITPKANLRPTLIQQIWYTGLSTVLLLVVLHLFTSIVVDNLLSALAVVMVVQFLQVAIQPVFSVIARIFGLVGILFISLFAYAIIMWLAFQLVPGIEDVRFGEALTAAWIYALLITLLQWIMLAQSDSYFLQNAVRTAKKSVSLATADTPGFIFVQLDGVSWQVLQWQLHTGNLPNIRRLIDRDYELRKWRTQIPSTTPASQAGILFGSHEGIPAFRWYERAAKRLVVANQPGSAHLLESRLSNGRGLLADGGVSIGNIFSGDAPVNIMVISKIEGDRQSLRSMREYSAYFSNLYGFMRALILSIGEMVKEIYQAQRQRVKDVRPRVSRRGSYIALRAATNVILRDLQTTIVLDKMMKGVNSIYVDYVDYDEIAHHAGIARPESLAALSGLDSIVGILDKATAYAPRPYHLVFLSDHGQSQGTTFRQLHNGRSLEELVGQLLGSSVLALTSPVESQSVTHSLLAEGSSGDGVRASAFQSAKRGFEKRRKAALGSSHTEIVVTGSGNLGSIWLKRYSSRPSRQQIEMDYPGFIQQLLETEGIGIVLVADTEQGFVCVGQQGEVVLKTGKARGISPLNNYPGIDVADLYKVSSMENAPDIQVISDFNPATGEVYAFEELVGNHGGIGGWQTDAILLHPKKLKISRQYLQKGEIVDSASIHRIFVEWLEQAGHRKDI